MRYKKWLIVFLTLLLGMGIIVVGRNILFNYLNSKENNFVCYTNGINQIYILGTIHNNHFTDPQYSMAEIQSVIDTVGPDLLLVEVRQDTVDQYGVLDGPIDMIFAWSYAEDNGINVHGIDWWQLASGTKSNTTTKERDDYIYENILAAMNEKQTGLVIVGNAHRVQQGKRLAKDGFTKVPIDDPGAFFGQVPEESFSYPPSMVTNIENKVNWARTAMVADIENAFREDPESYQTWTAQVDIMVGSLDEILQRYIIPNRLR